jgi:SIR2-like domain
MIDPLLSLAYSMHTSKGVYALLLGSGVSTGARVPTGWGITLDIIRKVAALHKESCEPDPEKWFRDRFRVPPGYSQLLEQLGNTGPERQNFLRSYIEPSPEEKAQGLKLPTAAHKAIAQLVASGHVRVILTTNFDRLMESALESAGIAPTVISSADAVAGATPLVHDRCTVVKLHGDYLDTRIKNTSEELARYEDVVNRLLDRILDDYGMVVCGWSTDWDAALRAAVERCPNRRYTTYWAVRGDATDAAKKLIALRKAEVIQIKDADSFFSPLVEKVQALEQFARPHPLSKAVAVASVKKFIENRQHAQLHDLVVRETDRVAEEMQPDRMPLLVDANKPDEVWLRMQRYEGLSEILAAIMATGCYWTRGRDNGIWPMILGKIANCVPPAERFYHETRLLRLYPGRTHPSF